MITEFKRGVAKNFDIKPNKTILENDGRSLIIQMSYDMDKQFWPTFSIFDEDYYFEYMYFPCLEKVPKRFSFENIAFHGELHAVFYDGRYKDFTDALIFDNVLILAFGIKVNPFAINKYMELKENLKMVQQPDTQTVIKNMPLAYWFNVSMEHFCVNTGAISLLSSPSEVTWMDVAEPIEITPEIVRNTIRAVLFFRVIVLIGTCLKYSFYHMILKVSEFQYLKNLDGKPLMNQFIPVTLSKLYKVHVCNYMPYEELEIENGSKRFEVILALIIFAQMGVFMAFGLP